MITKTFETYLGLLRGINVGGKNLIKMPELKDALNASELENIRTYIQSGNIIFESDIDDTQKLANLVESVIQKQFKLSISVAVFSKTEWQNIIKAAPKWWGSDKTRKHNMLVMLERSNMKEVMSAIGKLNPDIETAESGKGVVYQSMSLELLGRTTTGKLATNPIYKKMTIRNYNTVTKLLSLLG